jgi:hypothetical protein
MHAQDVAGARGGGLAVLRAGRHEHPGAVVVLRVRVAYGRQFCPDVDDHQRSLLDQLQRARLRVGLLPRGAQVGEILDPVFDVRPEVGLVAGAGQGAARMGVVAGVLVFGSRVGFVSVQERK